MILVADLKELFERYDIDIDKVLATNDKILEKGEYDEIEKILKYLRQELNIDPKNIEKCSSVLYFNTKNIVENYEFLKKSCLRENNIQTCLHILNQDPSELKNTYDYILESYGKKL